MSPKMAWKWGENMNPNGKPQHTLTVGQQFENQNKIARENCYSNESIHAIKVQIFQI